MQGGKNLVTQQVGELAIWVGGVYPCEFGNLCGCAGKDGAGIGKDVAALGCAGCVGGRRFEGAERGKLRESDLTTDFLCDLAGGVLCRCFDSVLLSR